MPPSVLSVEVMPGFALADPFMVASSHWTSRQNSYRQLAAFAPSAVTLKTTSVRTGGDGRDGNRDMRLVLNQFGEPFATYTDGPRSLELWDLSTTSDLSRKARDILPPTTTLGLSVLQGADEDYESTANTLDMSLFGYVELNWKYTFRGLAREAAATRSREVSTDLDRFFSAFGSRPCLVKLSREFLQYTDEPFFWDVLKVIADAGGAIIVANSLRIRVPPSRLAKATTELVNGVVVGEHLFLSTYNAVRTLTLARSSHQVPPIVAAGGILDLGAAIDVMAAGANAVQLCSALDGGSPAVLDELRKQLTLRCSEYTNVAGLLTAVRGSESEWAKVSLEAATESRTRHRSVARALENTTAVLAAVSETLTLEAAGPDPDLGVASSTMPDGLSEATIIVPRGNVLAYLTASRAAADMRMQSTSLESSYHLRQQIASGGLRYDFAVVTRSAFDYMVMRGGISDEERLPVEVGVIGQSFFELVGNSAMQLGDISAVYHFSGVTGRRALEELLRARKKGAATYELDNAQVLNTLRFFRETDGILAKPPLTRLYQLLVPKAVADRWGSLWRWKEDILLVGRRGYVGSDDGAAIAAYLLARMQTSSKKIAAEPGQAARACMDGIYWSYFAALLGARITW